MIKFQFNFILLSHWRFAFFHGFSSGATRDAQVKECVQALNGWVNRKEHFLEWKKHLSDMKNDMLTLDDGIENQVHFGNAFLITDIHFQICADYVHIAYIVSIFLVFVSRTWRLI